MKRWLYFYLILLLVSCSSKGEKSLQRCADELPLWPSYSYPYSYLPEELAKKGIKSLLLFSYGSLMDLDSASRTLASKTLATRRPALGFGIKRVFDRDVPIKSDSSWGIPCDPLARGMLNIQLTKFREEFVNGVLIEIPLNEVSALLEREEGYDLIPLVVADWESYLNNKIRCQVAYALQAGSPYTNEEILPRPGYYEIVRKGAAQYGPLFLLLWETTTFLADGKTPISLWEKWLKENDPCTCISNQTLDK